MAVRFENEFNEIFNTICDVSLFINTFDNENVEGSDIKLIFSKGNFIEKCIENVILINLRNIFDNKLKEYLQNSGKIMIPNVLSLKNICDTILTVVLNCQLNDDVLLVGINEYLKICGEERFVQHISSLVNSRFCLLKLSNLVKDLDLSIDLEALILLQSWLKTYDTHVDGRSVITEIITEMIKDKRIELLLAIANVETTAEEALIQDVVLKHLIFKTENNPDWNVWAIIFASKFFIPLIQKNIKLLELSLKVLGEIGNEMKFDSDGNTWILENNVISYSDFEKIFKDLYQIKTIVLRLRQFFYFNKTKENKRLWEVIENTLSNVPLDDQLFYCF